MLVTPCCGATVNNERPRLLLETLPVAAEAATLPPNPAMVRLPPTRSRLPASIGVIITFPLLGTLDWPAKRRMPSLICIVNKDPAAGIIKFPVPLSSSAPGPDFVKFAALKLPEIVEVPLCASRTYTSASEGVP